MTTGRWALPWALLHVVPVAVAAFGIWHKRPVRRGIWLLLLCAAALFAAGALVATWTGPPGAAAPCRRDMTSRCDGAAAVGTDPRYPAGHDVLRLLGYLLLLAGLLRLAGRRHPTREGGTLLDPALVAVATGTVAGVFLLLPAAEDAELAGAARWAAVAYPLAGVLVLAVLTRLVTTRGERTPAFRLLVAAAVAQVAGDLVAVLALRPPAGQPDPTAERVHLLFGVAGCVLFALAASHPSMASLTRSSRDGEDRLTGARLGALGAAMLLTPLTLGTQAATGGVAHVPLVVVGSVGVTALVLVRILGLYREVEAQHVQLAATARTDALTGLPNRRTWDFELARAAGLARERGESLVVALLDLDHFKDYNDAHGHPAGDALLRSAAAAWRARLGRAGTLARYGGEEFALLLPTGGLTEAQSVLQGLRAVTPEGQTFSAGATLWDFLEEPSRAVARADRALYAAKRAGRDRIVTVEPGPADPAATAAATPAAHPVG